MKLAMVTTYVKPANMRRELLATVRSRGHEVTIVAPEAPSVMAAAVQSLGATYRRWDVDRTGIDPIADLRAMRALYTILREVRADVVLVSQIKTMLLAPSVAKLARVPNIVALVNGLGSVFDDYGFGVTWKAKVARRGYKWSLRYVDSIVFQNSDDPLLLKSLGILSESAVWSVVPGTGVDLDKFAPRAEATKLPTFTLVSRLLVSKGIRDFIEAARIVRRNYPDTRFLLVGQLEALGHPDAISKTEIDRWVAEGLVDYLGFSNDMAGVLEQTTVFVLPSYYREGVPRTNLEALAIGRPIITTDWVGCRDTVRDGINGFLVAPKDVAAIADRIERYLRSPQLCAEHGRASRKLAESTFDIRTVNAMMLDALGL